ncbi:MAG: hypothetical protein GXP28_06900 [Planctomycetes bacterium]|nr:hypothetical protein [Planctomycetota bacterium]
MATIPIQEAQSRLVELIDSLHEGDEIFITRDKQCIAKITGQTQIKFQPRVPGTAKGKITILAEDDQHLADFQETMP